MAERKLEDDIVIEIPITEDDIEQFKDMLDSNEVIEWVFPTRTGKEFYIQLMTEDEYEQRGK